MATFEKGTRSYLMFEILFWTGMREGEMLALAMEDIDLVNKQIHITKTYYRANKKDIITEPKTDNSVRTIEIPDFLAKEIEGYWRRLYQYPKDERLFPVVAEAVQHTMKRHIVKAGIKKIDVHSLRHSHCAYLIKQGVQPLIIKERLGHKDIKITLNTYGHLYPNEQKKALQQTGFAKAVSKKENETVAWQQRERSYLTELCREKGIDIEVLGIQRDNLTLPEYKAAMREVETLEQQAEEMEIHNRELATQAGELVRQIDELEARDKSNQELLEKHDLRATTLKTISKEVDAEIKKIKSAAIPVNNLFGGEEYVKVKKSDWNKIMDAFSRAVSRNHLLEKYEKKISALEKKIATLTDQIEKLKQFVASRGLGEAFVEFVKSLAPKSFKQKLEEKKADVAEQNRLRKTTQQEMPDKKKKLQQEM